MASSASTTAADPASGFVYVYTSLHCGMCGRYVTDLGGIVGKNFAQGIEDGRNVGPGSELLKRCPEKFTPDPPAGCQREWGTFGLKATAFFLEPLIVMVDPALPVLYTQRWMCFH